MTYDSPIAPARPAAATPRLPAIGQLDPTVFGRRFAPPEMVKPLGDVPVRGRAARERIPGARLGAFEGAGHLPHTDVPERFRAAVLGFLADKR